MLRSELPASPEPILNDEASSGVAAEVYDFRRAKPGEVVRLATDKGTQELVRSEMAEEGDGSLREWRHDGKAVEVTLFEPNKYGTSFRLPGAVLLAGMEIGVNYVGESVEAAAITRILGRVASLASESEEDQAPAGELDLDK